MLAQKDREAIGAPSAADEPDPLFPRRGSSDDVRKPLNEMQTDGDMQDALDDADADLSAC